MVLCIFLDYFGGHGLIPYSLSSITKVGFLGQPMWLISDNYLGGRQFVMVSSIFLDYFGRHGLMPWHRSVNIGFPSQSIWFISDSYHQDDLL
jgi:hypothetical protein